MRLLLFLCLFLSWAGPVPAQDKALRVISLGPIVTENIYLLGAQERLVANTDFCVRPTAARNMVKIGSVMQVNIEKIVALRPDLILATGLTQPQQIEKMRSLGLRVVRFRQPATFEEICSQFLELGALLGMKAEAERIIAEARAKVAVIQDLVASQPVAKVLLQVGAQPLFSSVPSSFTHDFIRLAGGVNIAADQKRGGLRFEKVIAEDPAVIIVAIMGSESGIGAMEKEKWRRTPLRAARDNRVHVIDPDIICSPSPATFASTLGVVARLLHPELGELEDVEVVP